MAELPEKTVIDLNWRKLLAEVSSRCSTPLGEEQALKLPLLSRRDAIVSRLAEVHEARTLLDRSESPPLDGVSDLHSSLDRASRQAVLDPSELIAVSDTLGACRRLAGFFAGRRELAPLLARRALPQSKEEANRRRDLEELLGSCFEDDGTLSDRASPELARLRGQERGLRERLSRTIEELINRYEDVLQDRYFTVREERYVLPVRTDAHRKVHGIVHGHSGSGQTIYVEPREITNHGNELMIVRSEMVREEQRVLAELSGEVSARADLVAAALDGATIVDLRFAAGRLAVDLGGAVPTIADDGVLDLKRARHPLMVLDGSKVVANDIALSPGRVLIVSGPNGGGKTVALKTIGLTLLMVRAGLPVAADAESSVPLTKSVLTDMGDDQSIEQSLSTFAAHMTNIAKVLEAAGPSDVILLDELAGGTDPNEGAALATEIARALAARGAAVMLSTHYTSLKILALQLSEFTSASLGFDRDRLAPTYRLSSGAPGVSGALAAASRYGLPTEVVEAARERLGEDTQRLTALMEDLEAERDRSRRQADALVEERTILEQARRILEQERKEVIRRRQDKVQREVDGLLADLRSAREKVRDVEQRVRRHRRVSEAALTKATKDLDAVGRELSPGGEFAEAAKPDPPPGRPASADELAPGVRVWVPTMRGEGEIVEPPQRKKAKVALGRVTVTVRVDDLRIIDSQKPTSQPQLRPITLDAAGDAEVPAMISDNTLDLRGERVDDALNEVDKFIDKAMQRGWQNAFFIHGYGTGALKKALRAHFDESPWVERFKGGERGQGGDGVTVIWLA